MPAPFTRLSETGAPVPVPGSTRSYGPMLIDALSVLDGSPGVGGFAAWSTAIDSTTRTPTGLSLSVSGGSYLIPTGAMVTVSDQSVMVPDSTTTLLWFTTAGVLTQGVAWPATAHLRVCSVTASGGNITVIADARTPWACVLIPLPAGADQGAVTDSTGGTPAFVLAAVGNTSTGDRSADINNNFATLARLVAAMRTALVNRSVMKGSV